MFHIALVEKLAEVHRKLLSLARDEGSVKIRKLDGVALKQTGFNPSGIGDGFDQGDGPLQSHHSLVDDLAENREAFGTDFLRRDNDTG